MHAFFIGPPAQQLYACLHLAPAASLEFAALLLGTWGRELHRSHRMLRALADRLAMRGVPTLRFDWQGSGDSAGADTDANLTTWRSDARRAHEALLRRTGAQRVVWVGVRLGATVALQAAPGATRDLVLLDPVLDGPALLADWQHAHDADRASAFPPGNRASARVLATPSGPLHGEVMGFGISPTFAAELQALRPADLAPPAGARVSVLHHGEPPGLTAWLATHGHGVQAQPLAQSLPWLAPEGGGAPLVPAPAVNGILNAVLKGTP